MVQRVARILDVLHDAAAARAPAPSLTEVAGRSSIPLTSTHRLLRQLVGERFVERNGAGYSLGPRLFELGEHTTQRLELRRVALPFMQDLFEVTRQVVQLGVLDRRHVVYVEKIGGHRQVPSPSRLGGRVEATCTALGKAMLAYDDDAYAEAVEGVALAQLTKWSITDKERLRDDLLEVRKRGFAVDREEAALGLACVAAPLTSHGRVVGAISVSVSAGSFDVDRLAPAVRSVALAIGRRLR